MIHILKYDMTKHQVQGKEFYTEDVGWAVTAGIPMKFGTTHGRSRTGVGSTKRIELYGSGGVTRHFRLFGKSEQNIITLHAF